MTTKFKFLFSIIVIATIVFNCNSKVNAQEKKYKIGCIAFYNLENLFDTVNDTTINDEDFLPEGDYKWTEDRYQKKLENMSSVIAQIGSEYVKGPAIVGLSEVENTKVVEDLVATDNLKDMNYKVIHYDSPDERGVDVALIYQPAFFEVTNSKAIYTDLLDGDMTRDVLLVSGLFNGEPLHVLVNHWPSRSGGQKRSAPKRQIAAELDRKIIDSILAIDPKAKIILMGDLNDNPTDKSIKVSLGTSEEIEGAVNGLLYNPMEKKYKNGIGSNAYRDTWSLFDQIILSEGLLGEDKSSYKFFKAQVFNETFLTQKEGKFEGYPFRTYVGTTYKGGYSDHFPSFVYLVKEDLN